MCSQSTSKFSAKCFWIKKIKDRILVYWQEKSMRRVCSKTSCVNSYNRSHEVEVKKQWQHREAFFLVPETGKCHISLHRLPAQHENSCKWKFSQWLLCSQPCEPWGPGLGADSVHGLSSVSIVQLSLSVTVLSHFLCGVNRTRHCWGEAYSPLTSVRGAGAQARRSPQTGHTPSQPRAAQDLAAVLWKHAALKDPPKRCL